MQRQANNPISQNRNIILIAIATALVLLVPLVAMQFSDDVVWTWFDFAAAGVLLFGTGAAAELVMRRTNSAVFKLAIGGAFILALAFVWAQLAVGIFGD